MPQTFPEKTNVSIKSVLNHKKPAFWMILDGNVHLTEKGIPID